MSDSDRDWQGTLVLDPGRAAFIGPAGRTEPHAHHALQLTIGLREPLHVSVAGESTTCRAALIGANVAHEIDGHGHLVGFYYVEGSSREGRHLRSSLGSSGWLAPGEAVTESLLQGFEQLASDSGAECIAALHQRVARALVGSDVRSPGTKHDVADAVAGLLDELLPGAVRAGDLADRLGVRQRDLSARFRAQTGLSIRAYVLWLRLQRAVAAIGAGDNLTQAALAAGFADSAHLSRVFRKTFGIAPSAGMGRSRVVINL